MDAGEKDKAKVPAAAQDESQPPPPPPAASSSTSPPSSEEQQGTANYNDFSSPSTAPSPPTVQQQKLQLGASLSAEGEEGGGIEQLESSMASGLAISDTGGGQEEGAEGITATAQGSIMTDVDASSSFSSAAGGAPCLSSSSTPTTTTPSNTPSTTATTPTPLPATKVKVLLMAVGRAPRLAQSKFIVQGKDSFRALYPVLRRLLQLREDQALFLFVNSAFAPAPEDTFGDLFACFGKTGTLIVNYSLDEAWG